MSCPHYTNRVEGTKVEGTNVLTISTEDIEQPVDQQEEQPHPRGKSNVRVGVAREDNQCIRMHQWELLLLARILWLVILSK